LKGYLQTRLRRLRCLRWWNKSGSQRLGSRKSWKWKYHRL